MQAQRPIDLRSDTVTRPNAKMRKAMAEAEVGDDSYREDPTVARLQSRAAEIFGREAALFVASGTMGNLIAIHVHTDHGNEVICERRSHIYNYEAGGMAGVAGCVPRSLDGEDGVLRWAQIEAAIQGPFDFRAKTGLISLENTHNMAGGTVYPTEIAREIIEKAHARGIPIHLDGARVFNAAVALGESVGEITKGFDSVSFCFSKGLGAPLGSMLVGSRDFIDAARRMRRMLGGGMRQGGVIAAAALVALEDSPARLHLDHANAKRLAEGLAKLPGIKIDASKVTTNIVIFDVAGTGMDAGAFIAKLAAEGALATPADATRVRFVTHCDASTEDCDKALEAAARTVV